MFSCPSILNHFKSLQIANVNGKNNPIESISNQPNHYLFKYFDVKSKSSFRLLNKSMLEDLNSGEKYFVSNFKVVVL